MNIVMYTKESCPNCVSAKNLLKSKGLAWEEIKAIDDWNATWSWLREHYPDIKQMPAIFINDQYVGGFAGLQAALKQLGI